MEFFALLGNLLNAARDRTAKRQAKLLLALFAPLALAALLVTLVSAQETGSRTVCFWSDHGLACVDRTVSGIRPAGVDAQELLAPLLAGPSAEERSQGIWSAIPAGTGLAGADLAGDAITVRLRYPDAFPPSRLDFERVEATVQQVAWTLEPLALRVVHVEALDPATGRFRTLSDFLPPLPPPSKPASAPGVAAEPPALLAPAYTGQPPAPGQGQPGGALSGKTVYVSAGHGWEWDYDGRCACYRWRTQRPVYQGLVEDHNNGEAVNQYLLEYLWNAGALVIPTRERDLNDAAVTVDNDAPAAGTGYLETGVWTTTAGFGYDGGDCRWTHAVSGAATASAVWTTTLPVEGDYAIYTWYRASSENTPDAHYTIHHAGGSTEVVVDQRIHGDTWRYLGTYGFRGGEEARVVLTNQSTATDTRVAIADAVRFGGGTFDDLAGIQTDAPTPPDKPWWEVATYYYSQRMGMDPSIWSYFNDVVARPMYARWEHAGTGDDAVYVSWHTNGWNGTIRGTETYIHDTNPVPGSADLQSYVHSELVGDIRAGWDAGWTDRGMKQRNLGEVRELYDSRGLTYSIPGVLIEIAFHDNPLDAAALREPAFELLSARAIYQGIVRYYAEKNGTPVALLPEPPTHLRVENTGGGRVRVSWNPPPTDGANLVGDPATGYRVYTSTGGVGWSNGVAVAGTTSYTLTGLANGELVFVRVSATNEGGESFPTPVLGARAGSPAEVLLVDGFDRLNSTMLVAEIDPVEGHNLRMWLDLMNRYGYAIAHGQVISHAFDSACNEAISDTLVALDDYTLVDWILGEESAPDETLNAAERAAVETFLAGEGALFVSGAEVAWHLDDQGGDPDFLHASLRAAYAGDDAETYQVAPAAGSIFEGLASFHFDADGVYDADYPDRLTPISGSVAALTYQGGNGGTAAVQYADGCERLVYFGFPFETIRSQERAAVMGRALDFLDLCIVPQVNTHILTPTDGLATRVQPAFAGTAEAGGVATLDRVEVLVERGGQYWTGSDWGAETWHTAAGTDTWSFGLPALSDDVYHLHARAWTTGPFSDATAAGVVFTYDTLSPTNTTLITPTGGITVRSAGGVAMDWSDVAPDGGSDLAYVVAVDGQPVHTATQSTYTAAGLAEGPHTWGVQVIDAAGNRSAWVTDTFRVTRYRFRLPLLMRNHAPAQAPCSDAVANGGFESDGGWTLNQLAVYSSDEVHTGARSMRLGIPPGEPGANAFSSVMQAITLTAGSGANLSVWTYPIGEGADARDYHYLVLYDQWDGYHGLDFWQSDGRAWERRTYDVGAYLGQTIKLYVGTRNDGNDDTAALYVDDVTLEVCP